MPLGAECSPESQENVEKGDAHAWPTEASARQVLPRSKSAPEKAIGERREWLLSPTERQLKVYYHPVAVFSPCPIANDNPLRRYDDGKHSAVANAPKITTQKNDSKTTAGQRAAAEHEAAFVFLTCIASTATPAV